MEALSDHPEFRVPGGLQHARHRPEETLLYRIIDHYYPDFVAQFEAEGRSLVRGAWWRVPRSWSMKCCPRRRCVNGC